MSLEQTRPRLESCDCGTFFLDVAGRFTRQGILTEWTPQHRITNPEVERIVENTWASEIECAHRAGRRLYNGRLCRLWESSCENQNLVLKLGEVSFKEFLGTNLTHAYLRYFHGPEVLADAVGVSIVVTTSDGFIVLGRRSQSVFYHAGRIHPVGGMLEYKTDVAPHPFDAAAEELIEETNLDPGDLREMLCIGLVRDKHIVQPELIFDATVSADFSAIRQAHPQASDAGEHSELLAVRDHPAAVVNFIEQNFADLTPLGTASLLVHGLRHWGSGWFAATRGYLRSVI